MKNLISIILISFSCSIFSQNDLITLNFEVTNPDTIPEVGARVIVKYNDKIEERIVDEKGFANVELPATSEVSIDIAQYDTVFTFGKVQLTPDYDGAIYKMFIERHITYQSTTELDVHYASGSADLEGNSSIVLDQLVKDLKDQPSLMIEIASHTDNVGNDDSNKLLSQRRSSTVRKYLILKGVEGNRISAKGYGEKEPKSNNETEEGRAQNRRTEVRVIIKDK